MSDSALSQAEIDALLAGVDSSSTSGGSSAGSGGGSSGGADDVSNTLQTFLADTVGTQSSNLSMMTGTEVSMKAPQVSSSNREGLFTAASGHGNRGQERFQRRFPRGACVHHSQKTRPRA